jgi:hypothetical protein
MRQHFLYPTFLLVLTAAVFAHPGIGIVMNSRGEVFYTVLKQVWKISPDGRKSIAVANVHTHELYLDANDNLYGEHLWYEGEATDKWGHYVWKLHADGRLEQVIPPREGFREDYQDCSFVRDRAGNMYWAERGEPTIIRKRAPDGTITDLCKTHDFRDVRWMACSADGSVYLIDDSDLRRIASEGTVSTIAHNLKERALSQPWMGGLWLDVKRNIHVAAYSGRQVKKVSMDGKVTVAAHSNAPWGPTGGLVAPNGDLWLLEYSTANTARVRQIRRDGTEKIH